MASNLCTAVTNTLGRSAVVSACEVALLYLAMLCLVGGVYKVDSGFLYSLTEDVANDEWKMTDGVTETHVFDTTSTCPDCFPHKLSPETNPPA